MPEIEENLDDLKGLGIKGIGDLPREIPNDAIVLCIEPRGSLQKGAMYRVRDQYYDCDMLFIQVWGMPQYYAASRFAYNGWVMGPMPKGL